ncbi:MAG: helix-turn-helix domain-containing protein [Vicinamibacterales bacterium]
MAPTPRTTDFGARLREARERRGLSLREIADATKISARSLEALERNDIARLPGGIFSRAFVRAYAVHVGLDPEDTISEFMASFPDDSVTQGHPRTRDKSILDELEQDSKASRWPAVGWLAVIGVVVAALLTYALFSMYRGKNRQGVPSSAVSMSAPTERNTTSGENQDPARQSERETLVMIHDATVSGPWWSPKVAAARMLTSTTVSSGATRSEPRRSR